MIQSAIFLFLSLSFIIPNGNFSCINGVCELKIGNWHMHDAMWHISLAKLGFDTWPLSNPLLAGTTLKGYNFLLDFALYLLIKIGVPEFFAFFKLLPIIAGILYVWSVYNYVKSETKEWLKSNILTFFLYFGTSLSYLATIYADKSFFYSTLRGFPVVTSIHPATMFLNLQFAFSLSVLLWIIILLKSDKSKYSHLILGVLFAILFGLKFYGGVVGLMIFFLGSRKLREYISVILGTGISLIIFYGFGTGSSPPFTWAPFAITHLIIDDPLLFYNHNLTLARYYLYENMSRLPVRLMLIEGVSIILFLLINFGMRIIGVCHALYNLFRHKLSSEGNKFLIIIIATALIPIFFIQNGGWYNTMQFLYYGVWLSGILMTDTILELLRHNNHFKYAVIGIALLLIIPNHLEQLRFIWAEQNVISADELAAMKVLKDSPSGVVHILNSNHKNAIVPALAEKSVYYLDIDQLMVTNSPHEERLAFMTKYGGGAITTVPANYYLIYKKDESAPDALRALDSPTQYRLIYDSPMIGLYHRI